MTRSAITQARTKRCDVCGGDVLVTATDNPREFDWRCTGCPNRGSISWSRTVAPPVFTGAPAVQTTLALEGDA